MYLSTMTSNDKHGKIIEERSSMKKSPCAQCLHFYCCNLTQLTDSCPIIPVKPKENPFDKELDDHLESLVTMDFPLIHWSSKEGCEMGGGT